MGEDDQRWELLAGIHHQDEALLAGVSEVAAMLGVHRARISQLRDTYPDFPAPLAQLACGPIWSVRAVKAFQARHPHRRSGRPRKQAPASMPTLLARSSFGTPEARFLSSLTPPEVVDRILARAFQLDS